MKRINKYITEKLRISKANLKLSPETLEELVEMIKD